MGYNHAIMCQVLCIMLSAVLLGAPPAPGAQNEQAMSEAAVRDLWQANWPLYAMRYVRLGDGYGACAKFNFNFPSSRYVTVDQVKEMTMRTRVESVGPNMSRRENIMIPQADAEAVAAALPKLAVGEYGYIQGATVVEVLSPSEMIVDHVELVSEQQLEALKEQQKKLLEMRSTARNSSRSIRTQLNWLFQNRDKLLKQQQDNDFEKTQMKVVGFITEGLKEGDHWNGGGGSVVPGVRTEFTGVPLAIVASEKPVEKPSRVRRTRQHYRGKEQDLLVAVSANRLRAREVDEKQFEAMLEQRGYDKAKFVQLVLDQKRQYRDQGDERVIQTIEAARPQPAASQPAEEKSTP